MFISTYFWRNLRSILPNFFLCKRDTFISLFSYVTKWESLTVKMKKKCFVGSTPGLEALIKEYFGSCHIFKYFPIGKERVWQRCIKSHTYCHTKAIFLYEYKKYVFGNLINGLWLIWTFTYIFPQEYLPQAKLYLSTNSRIRWLTRNPKQIKAYIFSSDY